MTIRFKKFTAVIILMALMLSLVPLPVFAETTITIGNDQYTFCANENGTCSFSGTRIVAYGVNGVFAFQTITTSTLCSNDVFGDPIGGVVKACYYKNTTTDTIAPTTTDDAPVDWVNQDVIVKLTAADNIGGSGVAATNYTVNGGTQQTGTSVNLTADRVHKIVYWSVDIAGNVEAQHSKTVIMKLLPIKSNGQFHIDDVVKLITQGTLQEKDMNGDGIFDDKDVKIMLNGITSIIPM